MFKKLLLIFLIIIMGVNIMAYKNSENKTLAQADINQDEEKTLTRHILLRRFGEFSSAGSFVMVKIKNADREEECSIVCENTDWYLFISALKEYSFSSDEDYTDYMIAHYDEVFELSSDKYEEMKNSYEAPSLHEFEEAKKAGISFVADTYLKKGQYGYFIRDKKLEHNRSLLRMLLEMGLVVRRECESGNIYVEVDDIDCK